MAAIYIFGCFALMVGFAVAILGTVYALARGLWFGGLIGALAAILCLTFLLDCIEGVGLAYGRTVAQMEGRADG